jgi:hypothetical protein
VSDELELAGRVVQELEPAVRDFAVKVTASPTHELGELLADKMRLRRYQTQIKILEKAQKAAADAGLPASAVPTKVLAPLLAFSGFENEDDEDMVERWANLLANAATDSPAEVPPAFPDILRQLEPVDAKILDLLYTTHAPGERPSKIEDRWSREVLEQHEEFVEGSITQARLENLVRLGVASHPTERTPGTIGGGGGLVIHHDAIELSSLGFEFVRACQPPGPASSAS